jgi:hypothetical protein
MDETEKIINILADFGDQAVSLYRSLSSRQEVRTAAIAAVAASLVTWGLLRNSQTTLPKAEAKYEIEEALPQPAGVAATELTEQENEIEEELDGIVDHEEKWDQHAAEFCRKENVPNIRSYYKATSAGTGLFTARREEPVMYKEKTLPKKPIKKTPRRVTPAKATLSTKPKKLTPRTSPTKLTPRTSPRKSTRNPYGDTF